MSSICMEFRSSTENVWQATNFVYWQTQCMSGDEFQPLTDKMSAKPWMSFIDRQNVCQAKNFAYWKTKCLSGIQFRSLTNKMFVRHKISLIYRQNVCQAINFAHWQTKCLSGMELRPLTNKKSVNHSTSWQNFACADRQKVCQTMTFGLTDRLFVCHQ